jgi:hypothetical protein
MAALQQQTSHVDYDLSSTNFKMKLCTIMNIIKILWKTYRTTLNLVGRRMSIQKLQFRCSISLFSYWTKVNNITCQITKRHVYCIALVKGKIIFVYRPTIKPEVRRHPSGAASCVIFTNRIVTDRVPLC